MDQEVKRCHPIAPVAPSERVASIDVLRGFALLGILVINIELFALPGMVIFDPTVAGGFSGVNLLTWKFSSLFFLQKMMAIFSMLFGAGLVLMFDRFEGRGMRLGSVYYRRLLWLILIGLAHSYLIWYGDILFTYAICGLLLYFFRRRSAKVLVILGVCVLLFGMLLGYGSGYQFRILREASVEVEDARAKDVAIPEYKVAMADAWERIASAFTPTEERIAEEIEAYRGGYISNLAHRVPAAFMMQTQALAFMVFWRVMGLMLLGMALVKLGVFSALRSMRFYVLLAVIGYAIGLPLSVIGDNAMITHNFEIVHRFMVGSQLNYVGSILVALAHAAVVLAICKAGALVKVRRLLAGVGRTALTNYLAQSLICTSIFYGYGLGLFGRVERSWLLGFVLGIWIVQLAVSRWWLDRFQFGPAEWVWRSLTYWRRQPMRISR